MKDVLLAELKKIHELESVIAARIKHGLMPITDAHGLLTPESIRERIRTLADELMSDSSVKNPVLISLMDGALPFASALQDILSEREYPFQYTTMQVSSYVGTTSGKLSGFNPPKILVGGRDVIIVDDVCDTGKTYYALRKYLIACGADSVRLMALVDKAQERVSAEANPTYSGCTLSKDAFIVGMGMDYDGLLRTVKGIWAVDLSTLPTNAEKALLAKKGSLNLLLSECIAAEEVRAAPGSRRASFFALPGSGGASEAAALDTVTPETQLLV